MLIGLVVGFCYLAARIGGIMVVRPQLIWPLWPGCAVLVALLFLMPRKLWAVLTVAGLFGFVLYDIAAGLSSRSIALLITSDAIEILIAVLGVRLFFKTAPCIDSVQTVGRYALFAALIAPISVASIGAIGLGGSYWASWKVSFLTEALALLTITPAILGWVRWAGSWTESRALALETVAMVAGLALPAYITFVVLHNNRPELLYMLLPFLLWASLRTGVTGVSSAMVVVAFFSIWGATHGRGPFTGHQPLDDVWSLQLFLLFATATFLVLAAVVEEQKSAAVSLRESEARFRLVCNTAPVMIWMSGADGHFSYVNQRWLDFTGRSIEEELGNGWSQIVDPHDLILCMDTYRSAFEHLQSFKMECRMRRNDGEYRWISGTGVPRFDHDGRFAGYIGSCTDITDNKLAEQALSSVSQKLIRAQEQERTRIARELHDDINQRIALITIDLTCLGHSSESWAEAGNRITLLKERMAELGADVQAISHRLHSSKLEYLGLVTAIGSFCKELSSKHKVEISFSHDGIPSTLALETSHCLFRVLQECLNNALKHSGAREFTVDLRRIQENVHLTVSDTGVGFDPKLAMAGKGIGLISMQERLHLMNGSLSVNSNHTRGTTVRAVVPVMWSSNPPQAIAV